MKINLNAGIALVPNFCVQNKKNNAKSKLSFGYDKKVNVSQEKAKKIGDSLSTSTSGHRAVYGGEDFNSDVVELITLGLAGFANKRREQGKNPTVMVGGDTRVATEKSIPLIRDVLVGQGVDVQLMAYPVPTPLLALAARDNKVTAAALLTASHNPWTDGGYNIVMPNGAIAPAAVTKEIAEYMRDIASAGAYSVSSKSGSKTVVEPYPGYKKQLEDYGIIDWDRIKSSGIRVYYDALHGTGKNVFPRLMKDYDIPFVSVVDEKKEGPNPIEKNLAMLQNAVRQDTSSPIVLGLTNDGDADRFGIIDEQGNFVTPNDVILLVGYHLLHNRGKEGAIVSSQATSRQLGRFAQNNGFESIETPVGFKYIAESIMDLRKQGKDILVAGEESGGLTVSGHIPEKDGIIALGLIMDLVATEGKPLSQVLKEVKDKLGRYYSSVLVSKKMTDNEAKEAIMRRFAELFEDVKNGKSVDFSSNVSEINRAATIAQREKMETFKEGGDGYNFIFEDGSSLLFRKSGTEPLVKAYIEAQGDTAEESENKVRDLQESVTDLLD